MIKYYVSELVRRYRIKLFNQEVIKVLQTAPVVFKPNAPLIVSMVHHRDVLPYLAAVKSFIRYVPVSGIVVVADKSIDNQDRETFRTQMPGVIIRDASEFVRDGIPSGGCWERLVAISNYAVTHYVIQLDADTLTVSEPSSVIQAIKNNISFTLGTYDLQAKVNVLEVARWAQSHCTNNANPHIQLICESKIMTASNGDESKVYIRGCAGFTGFGVGSFSEDDVRTLSARMNSALKETWSRWGTEQFASNYIVSNVDKSVVLPHPVYTTPDRINHTTVFVHFIGPLRYSGGKYLRMLQKFLQSENKLTA
ncbi:hypothetical protein LHU53_09665 [Rhodoferax sp. U2-2l]|uniref:hypothetical protein n=1 Tax=Rhodoferax sp. U2-2l TaxID=2884000 RepID=UPI001D0AC17E|nr:hypothetical protein [Rhodoferax sp. U2-2l]MCB8747173.1 hypothetical protein [Rhodoferax sp. U2-2l]